MSVEFEAVIGIEVHCQLATETKIFCNSRGRHEGTVAEEVSNLHTCPVCAGHPGTLPVLNKKAVEMAIRAGVAMNCNIRERSVFARKNYFYPDLPKGYQISQFELPICEGGEVEIRLKDGSAKKVRLERIHMEEDAGKNVHVNQFSLVNLNRAGVPLIEIVTAPDMTTSEEAGAYLRALHSIVTYIGICDGNLQEGNFRADANVSVKPKGQKELGKRVEIKNVNSFRFVEKAIDYEIARQIETINAGGVITQETRTYDSAQGITITMRSKEEAHDYRYFPDPDLPPLMIETKFIDSIRDSLPELPLQKRDRFISQFGLSDYDSGVLTSSKEMAQFFEECMERLKSAPGDETKHAKLCANFLTGEIARLLNENEVGISGSKVKPKHIADIVENVLDDAISITAAKQVLGEAWSSGKEVSSLIDELGLKQVSDSAELEPVIDEIIAKNPGQVEQYRAGKEKLFGFFVGQAMKATGGKANPKMLQDLIKKKLERSNNG